MKQANSLTIIYTLILALSIPYAGIAQEPVEEDVELADLIFDYSNKAYDYFKININLDSAEFYYEKAIDLALSSSNYYINHRVANNYISLASVYRDIYNNIEALKHLNEAEKILRRTDPKHSYFGTVYHNKGNIFRVQNDYYRTKEYYEYALDFLTKNGYQDSYDFAFVFSNYVELILELEDYELAEDKITMIDFTKLDVSPIIEYRLHFTIASLHSQLGKYDLANKHFLKANRILEIQPKLKEYTKEILNYYYKIIQFHIFYGEYNQALADCDNALIFIESLDPLATKSKIVYRSNISYRSAAIHFEQGNHEKSLWIVNNSIMELNEFLDNLSIEGLNNYKTKELTTALPDLYVLKSRILFEVFNKSNKFEDLVSAYEAYQKTIETLNNMRLAIGSEDSRVFATSQILEAYKEAIYVGKLLYDLTGEFKYLEQAFVFTETSKSFALYSEIKNLEAMQFSDLPIDIKQREKRYSGEIQAYEELLYKEQIKTEPDSSMIASFKETLFHLKDDYDDLKQEISQNYANY